MIDFDALVLKPAMDAFARPIVVTPIVSQPGQPAYGVQADGITPLRGVYSIAPGDMALQDGSVLATDVVTIGVRGSEFAVSPLPGDQVYLPPHQGRPAVGPAVIEDDGYDGEGGYEWVVKMIAP